MEDAQSFSVGELAAYAGVSVRALRHYDEIGLLSPCERTAAGYRRYSRQDAERLHRILIYRELGFDLTGIARILDDPDVDALEHLQRQRALLDGRIGRLQRMLRGVEAMMNAKKKGYNLTPGEMREVFGRWFYDCSYAIHRGLGEMYIADPRFAAHYEDQAPGLSTYLRDAIIANADRGGLICARSGVGARRVA